MSMKRRERIPGSGLGRGSTESVEEIYRQAFYLEFDARCLSLLLSNVLIVG